MASVITNTIIAITGRIGGVAAGLIITAILGRVLGVEKFGDYSLLLSFGAILHVMTDGGLYLTLAKEISKDSARSQALLSSVVGLRVVMFCFVFLIGAVILYFLPNYHNLFLLYGIAALGFLFQSLSQLMMAVFQSNATMWRATVGDLVGRAAQLWLVAMLAYGFFTGESSLVVAISAFVIGAGVAYGVHAVLVPGTIRIWKPTFSLPGWRKLIARSWPLGLMLILNALYFRTDMLMISWFRSSYEVGLYGLAYRVIESALFFPAAFGGLLLPKIVAAKTSTTRAQLLEQALIVMLVVGGLVYSLIPPLSSAITAFLAGPAFTEAGPLLSILTAALVIMFFGNLFGFSLVALDQQRVLLKLYAWLALGNILGNLLLIPRYGATAAAWTTVLTEACATFVAGFLVAHSIPYKIDWRIVAPILAVAAATTCILLVFLSGLHVIFALIISATAYSVLAALFGLLRLDRISLLLAK